MHLVPYLLGRPPFFAIHADGMRLSLLVVACAAFAALSAALPQTDRHTDVVVLDDNAVVPDSVDWPDDDDELLTRRLQDAIVFPSRTSTPTKTRRRPSRSRTRSESRSAAPTPSYSRSATVSRTVSPSPSPSTAGQCARLYAGRQRDRSVPGGTVMRRCLVVDGDASCTI